MPTTKMAPKICECTVDDLRDGGIESLLVEHWEEVALHKDVMQLNPDWVRYYELEERGELLILAAIDQRDGVVGYSVNFLTRHPHYSMLVVAQNDLLFVTEG